MRLEKYWEQFQMDGEYMTFILLLFIILYKFDIFFEWENKGNRRQKLKSCWL